MNGAGAWSSDRRGSRCLPDDRSSLHVSAPRTAAQARLAALPLETPAPADNPTTPERVALGRLLFWDPILSGQRDVACATCHHPDFGYSDGLDLSVGANGEGLGAARAFAAGRPARLVKRNSQTVLNVAFNGLVSGADPAPATAPMFWDLRVRSLEAQALEPIKALEEMRGEAYPEHRAVPAAVARLNGIAEYRQLFARAFGGSAAGQRTEPRARAGGVSAHAGRRQRPVRSLHARRDRRVERRAAARHGTIPVNRLRQLPQRSDVLRLHGSRARGARQPEAARVGFGSEQDLRLPHAVAAQPRHDGSLHAQRRLHQPAGGDPVLPADQPRRRTARRRRRHARSQRTGRPRSDRSAGASPEHARPWPGRSHRLPRALDDPASIAPSPNASRAA